ncbi:MAG: histidine phosphatase family protein [Chlamydiales bacterium]|nr:histidine phosphatase family protein [Chlamydiales bacterium]
MSFAKDSKESFGYTVSMGHLSFRVIFMAILCGAPLVAEATSTCVYLVRHGETEYNQQKRIQGHKDIPLNSIGRMQAQEAKVRWQGIPLVAGYCSDLIRARETLQLLVEGRELPLNEDVRLREQGFGKYEGFLIEDFQQQASPSDVEIEGQHLLLARMLSALEEIAQKHNGEHVLVVSHGGAMRMVLAHILGERYDAFRTENLAHLYLNYDAGKWSVIEMTGIYRKGNLYKQ